MTMVLDQQQRHYGGSMYDAGSNMYSNHIGGQPHFNDPWNSATSQYPSLSKHDSRSSGMPMQYSQLPTSAPMSSGSYYTSTAPAMSDILSSQDMPRSTYGTEQTYSSPATTQSSYATAYPSSLNYAQSLHQQQQHQQQRKITDPTDNRSATAGFNELDASRGMLALSHQNIADLTPRNIYEARAQRGSTDGGYGFPQPPSNHSSISAESGRSYPYYGGSSVASSADSATDYSSAASDAGYDSMTVSRTLPRPTQILGTNLGVPAPQSMMGQFSSKMSSNTQKKHKCKVCDKRFTRPSSLQTHMYSHTGEKPFACNFEGCGRHFSVVSNLRRHKKVHKGETLSNHSDTED